MKTVLSGWNLKPPYSREKLTEIEFVFKILHLKFKIKMNTWFVILIFFHLAAVKKIEVQL